MSNIFRGLPYENDQKSIFFQICIQHPQSQFFHFYRVCYCHRAQIHFIHRLLSCGEFNSPFSTGSQSVCDTGYPCKRDLRVCMALKLNRNLDNNIPSKPTKNITKSEKAYPAYFAVSSMLLSASKRCFERFSWEMVCVVCCVPKASRGLPLLGTF